VVKLDTSGGFQWYTFYGSATGDDYPTGIAVDGSGNVFVAGVSNATWNGPSNQAPLNFYSGGDDMVVLKLDTNGNYQWHTFMGSASGNDEATGIAVDGNENVYVTGYSPATWTYRVFTATYNPLHAYTGDNDMVVAKFNSSGAYQWHTFYGSTLDDTGQGILADGTGNVYVTGYSMATWNGPSGQSPVYAFAGGEDIVVLKLDTNGAYLWHTFYGSSSADSGSGIAMDGNRNIYVAGASSATWNGPSNRPPLHAYAGAYDIVVVSTYDFFRIYLPLIMR
jgi:Beta-propeller repeat